MTAARALRDQLRAAGVRQVRVGWCDLHGQLRGKTLTLDALDAAFARGVGLVGTLLLKDTSDRTALPVFDAGALDAIDPALANAANLLLRPDAESMVELPWAPGTAWLRGDLCFGDGTPVALCPRRVLQAQLARLAEHGFALHCGLEVEFHVYRLRHAADDPMRAAWPPEPPEVALVHPGHQLLSDAYADAAHEVLAIVQHTAEGLGLPLRSLEIELGPSQFEAVFDVAEALVVADRMVRFRNGVRQALARAGYHASFMCRPPFEAVQSSGWHLHQSLVALADGTNAFTRAAPAAGAAADDAAALLSDTGGHWLAGLIEHAAAASSWGCSTVNAFGRFRPRALAPVAPVWGRDHRGAMLRVLGGPGDPATRIENRLGEPMANPYLYIASQVACGLDGLQRRLVPPRAASDAYASGQAELPRSLEGALDALAASTVLTHAFGPPLIALWNAVKRSESRRHADAPDPIDWQRREYFSRY